MSKMLTGRLMLLLLGFVLLMICVSSVYGAEKPKMMMKKPKIMHKPDHIILEESHKQRHNDLKDLLADFKQKLDDHHSGKNPLDPSDRYSIERKVEVFERKVEEMEDYNIHAIPDETKQRIIEREKLLVEHDLKYGPRDARYGRRRDREEL